MRAKDYHRVMRISLFLFFLAGLIIFWVQSASANSDAVPFRYNKTITLDDQTVISAHYAFSGLSTPEKQNILVKEDIKQETKEEQSNSFTINASAYTASADECGNSLGITASGEHVKANHTLACPPQYAFGTQIKIDGYGTFTCKDRGGAIKGNHFDIYMETKAEAFAFGRRNLTAYVVG